jgi:hypothetical protein
MKSIWVSFPATLLSILTIICLSFTAGLAESGWVDYQGTGFSLLIPASFNAEKTTPAEDFDLFHFYGESGKLVLGAYVGNHPQFPDAIPENEQLREGTLGGKSLQYAEWKDREVFYGEFLVLLHPGGAPGIPIPVYTHLWYLKLNPEELAIAKKILDTFRATR